MAEAKTDKGGQAQETVTVDAFADLLKKEFRPKSDRAKAQIESAVQTLASQVLSDEDLILDDAVNSINAIIAEIDLKLTQQVNLILHHPDFQKLEGAWRGLNYLVQNSPTDKMLKIRFMPVSKQELSKTLKRFKGVAWDQSPLFKKVYGEEYDTLGGEPYGCLVGDYAFDHSPQDVEILQGMAQIAAAAHAPFIAGASPNALQMDSFQELQNPKDIAKIFTTPEYAAWRSLRESEDSRYIGLAMPRFLARLPWGAKTEPVEEFDFEEDMEGSDSSRYTWANSAYAMALNVNQAFKAYGWCSRIRGVESGGSVEGLPVHTFPSDDGGVDMKCPTEISIGDRREKELADAGFMPLIHRKNSDMAAFIERSRCSNRPPTTIPMRPPTRICRRACRTSSPAAVSRTL
jgi:type VI secretion system protein ImpC